MNCRLLLASFCILTKKLLLLIRRHDLKINFFYHRIWDEVSDESNFGHYYNFFFIKYYLHE